MAALMADIAWIEATGARRARRPAGGDWPTAGLDASLPTGANQLTVTRIRPAGHSRLPIRSFIQNDRGRDARLPGRIERRLGRTDWCAMLQPTPAPQTEEKRA